MDVIFWIRKMGIFRALLKLYILLALVLSYVVLMSPLVVVMPLFPIGVRRITGHTSRLYARLVLKTLGIRFSVQNLRGNHFRHQPHLIVSNHLSYLDVLLISSLLPVSFVTSRELQKTPILGQISDLAGCIYVDRRKVFQLPREIESIKNALKGGLHVMIFPEATSANGEKLLKFRRPLLKAAVATGTPTLIICLNYRSVDGVKISRWNRDRVFWYGKMSFVPHFWRMLFSKEISVDIHILGTVDSGNFRLDELTENIFQVISDKYDPI